MLAIVLLPVLLLGRVYQDVYGITHDDGHSSLSIQPDAVGMHATHAGPHPQVLVIVSDHGSGTSNLGKAVGTHPCVFDMAELFGDQIMLWSANQVEECSNSLKDGHGQQYVVPPSLFDGDTHVQLNTNNPKLDLRIQAHAKLIKLGLASEKNSSSIYKGLKYNLAEYFVRIRDLVCKDVPATQCPPADCAISLKLFPQYVNGQTTPLSYAEDYEPSACIHAINEKAMRAWKDALSSFEQNPKIATLTLTRNERDRQFSMFHRFTDAGSVFDCSIPRAKHTFAAASMEYTGLQMEVEDCWNFPSECLVDTLKLIGLTQENMGKMWDKGLQMMTGELENREEEGKLASKSCSTDPLATFMRMENNDVMMYDGP